ncbi:MAG: tetratricopeptide repeat protein [Phycisphaerae bacterium]|nr:tetratricopeptide repeat protein [Phycisphaerae bacterium]
MGTKHKKHIQKASSPKRESSQESTTGQHLWLFRIVAITVIPVLFFLLLEVSLRIVGYGYPPEAIIKGKSQGKDAYRDNVKFGWRFFPKTIARDFTPFVFPLNKPADAYRIFIFGSSAANGDPDEAFCFGRFLQTLLRQQYPKANFEVITAAMAAINSHVVLEIAKDCAQYQPDLFIVYLGNNEVVGPYGPGTVFSGFSSNLRLIRLGIAIKATKLGQLLTNLLELASAEGNRATEWQGLEMFLEKQVRADDKRMNNVYQHFDRNLRDICRAAHKAKAKTILCTVGANLKDCPPFACLHKQNLSETEKKKWDEIYQQAIIYESAGDYTKAVESYLAAGEIDDCYADLQFRLGRCYCEMNEYDKAKQRYTKARELDTLRFRADTRINESIRNVAGDKASEDVFLIDTAKALEENSPNEITGNELFYEHVHLNFKGNYLLAKTVFDEVEKVLPEQIKNQKTNEHPLPTEAECAQYLAYTNWDQYRIAKKVLNGFIKRAPFTNQLDHSEQVRKLEEDIEKLKDNLKPEEIEKAAAQYRFAIENNKDDWFLRWKYAKLLVEGPKDYEAAIEQYRLMLEYLDYYAAQGILGGLLGTLGDTQAAIDHNLRATEINPNCANAHYNLALAYQELGQIDKAIAHYYQTLRLRPSYLPQYNEFGTILYEQGKIDKAIELYRKGVYLMPDSMIMHCNLGLLLGKQGHKQKAIKELRTALQLEPNSIEIRRELEKLSY